MVKNRYIVSFSSFSVIICEHNDSNITSSELPSLDWRTAVDIPNKWINISIDTPDKTLCSVSFQKMTGCCKWILLSLLRVSSFSAVFIHNTSCHSSIFLYLIEFQYTFQSSISTSGSMHSTFMTCEKMCWVSRVVTSQLTTCMVSSSCNQFLIPVT